MSTALIILTWNEIDGVKKILPQINRSRLDEILVVDGGSTDGTLEFVKECGFNVIIQSIKGHGGAILTGVQNTKSENIIIFGPDGNHDVDEIYQLMAKIDEGYDQVVISRFGKESVNLDAGTIDAFGNRMFTFLVNVFFGGKLTDSLFGFKIVKKKIFQDLNLDGEFLTLEQQMSIKSCKYNLKIYEIDGKEPKRIGGEAKMKPLDTGYALSKQIIKEFIRW